MVFKRKLKYLAAAVSGLAGYYLIQKKNTAFSSWTTNTVPSVQWDWNWDRREPSSLLKPSRRKLSTDENNNLTEATIKNCKNSPTRHLIFIRHGHYNMAGLTDEDKCLTLLGRQQASLTGERLKSLSWPYTRLVHSSMTRAAETAAIIAEKLQIKNLEKCDLLREGAPIPPEPPVGSWKAEMHKFFTDGARIEAAFREYFYRAPSTQTEDSYEVFVCHANVIRYFVCRALQFPPEAWLRISLHNGSITYLIIRPDGRVGIRLLGDCGHIAPDKLTLN